MSSVVSNCCKCRMPRGLLRALLVGSIALSVGIGLALRLRPERPIHSVSIDSTVLPILQAAVVAETPEEICTLLEQAEWAAIRHWYAEHPVRTRNQPYVPDVHRGLWEALLADRRIVGNPEYEQRVFVIAAKTLELFCGLGSADHHCGCEDPVTWDMPAVRRQGRTLERARARLEGRTHEPIFPHLPTAQTKAAVLADIHHVSEEQLPMFVRGLDDAKYMALMDLSASNKVVRARLLAMARTVRHVPDPSLGLPIEVGQPLSAGNVSSILVWLKNAALEGRAVQLSVVRRTAEDGLDICLNAPFPTFSSDTNLWPNCVEAERPSVLGSVRHGADGMWPAATLFAEHLPPIEEDWNNIAFWIHVDRALTSKDASPFKDVTLFLLTR